MWEGGEEKFEAPVSARKQGSMYATVTYSVQTPH